MDNSLKKRPLPLSLVLQSNRRGYRVVAALAAVILSAAFVSHAEAACVTSPDGGTVTCTGNESGGIASGVDFSSPPATTLYVYTNPITTSSPNVGGVNFSNAIASGVNVISGTTGTPVAITTSGIAAPGITALSEGSPSAYRWNNVLGLYLPSGPAGGGGPVTIDSHSTIVTSGDKSYGIVAKNRVGSYDPTSSLTLQTFTSSAVAINLVSVAGNSANIGNAVTGSNGGTFTLNSNGTVSFDRGMAGNDLELGESLVTSLTYQVQLAHNPLSYPFTSGSQASNGTISARIVNDNGVITVRPLEILFADFGVTSNPEGATPLWPNLQGYVNRLKAEQGLGGSGESIVVTNSGSVTTRGNNAHGIFAETTGGTGATGSEGGLFDGPAGVGGSGSSGGGAEVTADGTITTYGNESAGVAVVSRGGNGGTGGDGGWGGWRWGGQGGNGSNGGGVSVYGSGTIETGAIPAGQTGTDAGDRSSGILALSEGGNGGNGGEGHQSMPGGNGGWGGSGGTVVVDGSWKITTRGDWAHGIWAKSVGGNAGSGGSAGWMGIGSGGTGGQAADGGSVTVTSRGEITTRGDNSYGIFGQSVGGFGGSGGDGGYIFYSNNGDGNSAGSGGVVSVTNDSLGNITTYGERAHGVYAQSVGGGGGTGIDGGGVVSIGGDGGAGGHGGAVTVVNNGSIRTYGNRARGVFAESIGGGGGSGGESDGVYSVGGSGSATGNGGLVTVTNTGRIETGTFEPGIEDPGVIKPGTKIEGISSAIHAQSIGGGGGSGAESDGLASVGGSGGSAGDGGEVAVTNSGALITWADFSRGILAQSIGGGGGDGASSDGLISTGGSTGVDTNNDGIMDTGGGSGKIVDVVSGGSITTHGDYSDGIYAQSVGGGGGSGGSSKGIYAIGGSGSRGGSGSTVTITNSGTILTEGYRSRGIFAESIGGGGGDADSVKGFWTIGGSGSSTDDGGDVIVTNRGVIETKEASSSAIHVQSVGGGGGSGASSENIVIGVNVAIGKSIGGDGGAGGKGGNLTVTNENTITTHKDNSHGMFAQSIGGGGGSGGDSTTYSLVAGVIPDVPVTISATYTIGGKGSFGGNGGTVQINNSGSISTAGFRSYGVFAQSIGGGGGDGGSSSSYSLCIGCNVEFNQVIGGDGGGAGNGGSVGVGTAQTAGTGIITTQGDHSVGILAQSIGGGGGAAGDATNMHFAFDYALSPEDLAPGFGFSSNNVMSGSSGVTGSARGDGGTVLVNSAHTISTEGAFAHGILAQSVGGGGGAGGDTRSYNFSFSINPTDYVPYLDVGKYSSTQILGGDGANGGVGSDVTVINAGTITTKGASAYGILAQSVGGGGGARGSVLNVSCSPADIVTGSVPELPSAGNFESVMRGMPGGAGQGGNVTVTSGGTITTHGAMAHGILAQSVGGGGGVVGAVNQLGDINTDFGAATRGIIEHSVSTSATFLGSLGGTGSGGIVTVSQTGFINTTGSASHGILAQSSGGSGGAVNVTTSGSINAQGEDAIGILAQSVGRVSDGNISITIDGGTVQGGTGAGTGVSFMDGAANTLINRGTITTVNGIGGNAIIGTRGNDAVTNYGTITGKLDLGTGTNSFGNQAKASFNSGATVNLGTGNTFTNSGAFSPGGDDGIVTTALTGNFEQKKTGTLAIDVNSANGKSDRLNVTGTATLDGRAVIRPVNSGRATPGTRTYTILSGQDGVIDADKLTLDVLKSHVISYQLLFSGNDVLLKSTVDFHKPGLKGPQGEMGEYINRIQLSGGSDSLAPFMAEIFKMSDAKEVAAAYESLSPDSYTGASAASGQSAVQYMRTLGTRMQGIRSSGISSGSSLRSDIQSDNTVLLAYNASDASIAELFDVVRRKKEPERYGVWLDGFGSWGDQGADPGFTGFDYNVAGGALGLDFLLRDRFIVGISAGYSYTSIDLDDSKGTGNTRSSFGSIYGSYFTRDYYLETTFSYARQEYNNTRNVDVGALHSQAYSTHRGNTYAFSLAGGYNFAFDRWLLQPLASLRYTFLGEDGFQESGAGGASLIVGDRDSESLVSELGLRLARIFETGIGSLIPELRAAWNYDFGLDDRVITAAFSGSPNTTFSVRGQEVKNHGATVGTGITLVQRNGFSTSLKYDAELREDYSSHGLFGEIRYSF